MLRTPDIMSDAIIHICQDPKTNGKILIDEDYLRNQCGKTNFDEYRINPDFEPPRMMPKVFPSLNVEEEN